MIGAVAALVLAVAVFTLVVQHGLRRVDAKFGKAELSLEAVDRKLDDVLEVAGKIAEVGEKVNVAVNKTEGPRLIERVQVLEAGHKDLIDHQRWEADALTRMASQIGVNLGPAPLERRFTTGETPVTTVVDL